MRPKDPVSVDDEVAVKVMRLVEKIEELDDVQTVYTNLHLTDSVLAQVG
jgi:transcriptional/translational regulatory protein YebC/TACO1